LILRCRLRLDRPGEARYAVSAARKKIKQENKTRKRKRKR
jgi:hypothetical protein